MSEIQILKRRVERERKARQSAESILEEKSREVYSVNLELIRVANDLRRQIEKTQAILNYAAEGIVTLDENQLIQSFNPAAERIFGISLQQAVGTHVASLLPDATAITEECMKSRQPFGPAEFTCTTPDGNPVIIELTISAVADIEDRLLVLLVRDRTRRKQLESQLALAQKMESVGQLAAGIAHEINTPIQFVGDNIQFMRDSFNALDSLVSSYEQLLKAEAVISGDNDLALQVQRRRHDADIDFIREEVPEAIEQTRGGIERVASIVRAMKEFSHPGNAVANALNVNDALESTLTVSRNEWKYVAKVETQFDEELPSIHGFPGDLNQAFLNIIVNAAHAIEQKNNFRDQLGTIQVVTRCASGGVEIQITDDGCGICAEQIDRVFDPFFTTKPVGKGTGQGLSIVHAVVVEKHGGRISVESNPGVGTSFYIFLPIECESQRSCHER